jgi:hypothetical protein
MEAPAPIERGPGFLKAWLNELRAFTLSRQPLPSETADLHETPGGTQILVRSQPSAAGGASASTHPFLLVDASTTGPTVVKVRCYSGMVNALDPVTIGPFEASDDPPFTVVVTNGQTVYLDLTLSYSSGTGIWSYTSYNVAAAASLPSATATRAYLSLGTVTVSGGSVTAITGGVAGNIGHERCGNSTTYVDYWWAGP